MKHSKTDPTNKKRYPGPSRWTRLPQPPPAAPSRAGERWSERDEEILEQYYTTHGSAYTAALLGRTHRAIRDHAVKRSIDGYETRSWRRKQGEAEKLREELSQIKNRPRPKPTAVRGTYQPIADNLGRTRGSVAGKASLEGLSLYSKSEASPDWSERDEKFLRRKYGKLPIAAIAEHLGRSTDAISIRASILGLHHGDPPREWTPRDDRQLARLHEQGLTPAGIAETLGRMKIEIVQRSNELGIYRPLRHWTDKEDQLLRELYRTHEYSEIARMLNRSIASVTGRVAVLGIAQPRAKRWSPKEDALIRESYRHIPTKELARRLGRSPEAVGLRAASLGLSQQSAPPWSEQEDQQLREMYGTGTMGYTQMAEELGRTRGGVEKRIRQLELRKETPMRRYWTPKEDAQIRQLHGSLSNRKIAERLGRSLNAVALRARHLGLGVEASAPWTAEDDNLVRKHYGIMPRRELAEMLGRTIPSLTTRAGMLGVYRRETSRGKK